MRCYYDTEFIEIPTRWGNVYDLISLGMVAEDGRELYAVNADMDTSALHRNPWLVEHVWSQLPVTKCGRDGNRCRCVHGHLIKDHPDVWPRAQIAQLVYRFLVTDDVEEPQAELWADHAAHDHVVLTGLFGGMGELPPGIPMWTHDLRQEIEKTPAAEPLPEQAEGLHNALSDARYARELGRWLAA